MHTMFITYLDKMEHIFYTICGSSTFVLNHSTQRYTKGESLMPNHPIVHVDIPANDPAVSSKFYADLFSWNIQFDQGFDYHMFQAENGPGGGFVKVGENPPYKADEVLIYVS